MSGLISGGLTFVPVRQMAYGRCFCGIFWSPYEPDGAPICGEIFAMHWVYFLGGPWIIINFNFYKNLISFRNWLECSSALSELSIDTDPKIWGPHETWDYSEEIN
jgi:hypothetical protein